MKKLTEAPKSIKIKVTKEDIRLGEPGLMSSCAIARSIKRTMGDHPSVDELGFNVSINSLNYFYEIPNKASKFIAAFDDGEPVKPMEFVAKRVGLT